VSCGKAFSGIQNSTHFYNGILFGIVQIPDRDISVFQPYSADQPSPLSCLSFLAGQSPFLFLSTLPEVFHFPAAAVPLRSVHIPAWPFPGGLQGRPHRCFLPASPKINLLAEHSSGTKALLKVFLDFSA
jgi:hypothetical protein